MAIGVNIAKANLAVTSVGAGRVMLGKANLAVQSHPPSRIAFSKSNFAVTSHPPGRVVFSKANFSVSSNNDVPPVAAKRRQLFLNAVCGQPTVIDPGVTTIDGSPLLIDGNTVEFD